MSYKELKTRKQKLGCNPKSRRCYNHSFNPLASVHSEIKWAKDVCVYLTQVIQRKQILETGYIEISKNPLPKLLTNYKQKTKLKIILQWRNLVGVISNLITILTNVKVAQVTFLNLYS